jgi:Trk K+ transport system NAD-binding subunit
MSDHIIVCGMGDIGYRVAELLHRLGEQVVAVTDKVAEGRRHTAEALGVRVLLGDARDERLLIEAGLASARGLVAATDNDLANIEIALDARRLRPDLPVVVRLFDQTLARQMETAMDLRRVLGMSALAAPSFAAAALGDAILASLTLGDASLVAGRSFVEQGPLATCEQVGEVVRRHRLHVLVLERPGAEGLALPGLDEPLQTGDRLTLFGRKEDWEHLFGAPDAPFGSARKAPWWHLLRRSYGRTMSAWREAPSLVRGMLLGLASLIALTLVLFRYALRLTIADAVFYTVMNLHGEIGFRQAGTEIRLYQMLVMILGSVTLALLFSLLTDYLVGTRLRKLLGGRPMPKKGHVVVVGMGEVGYRIVVELKKLGIPVVAVDANPDAPFLATLRTLVPVVLGDGRLNETLERAGLARAWAVVAATRDDTANLGIGLEARKLNTAVRTVVRLFDVDFARKVESAFGIDVALGASRIAAPTFAASVLFPDVAKAFIVHDRLLVLRLCRIGAEWTGKKPAELRTRIEAWALLMRKGCLVTYDDEEPLAEGEEILAAHWRRLDPSWLDQMSSAEASSPSPTT